MLFTYPIENNEVVVLNYFCLIGTILLFIQLKADHSSYYRDALRYLGCMDINDISGEWVDGMECGRVLCVELFCVIELLCMLIVG